MRLFQEIVGNLHNIVFYFNEEFFHGKYVFCNIERPHGDQKRCIIQADKFSQDFSAQISLKRKDIGYCFDQLKRPKKVKRQSRKSKLITSEYFDKWSIEIIQYVRERNMGRNSKFCPKMMRLISSKTEFNIHICIK